MKKDKYDGFEASITSGLTADPFFIKKNDEIVQNLLPNIGNTFKFLLTFLVLSCAFFFIKKIIMIIFLILAFISFVIAIIQLSLYRKMNSNATLKMIYEEGLLSPSIIVKENPLTILSLVNITVHEGCKERYACYSLEVKHLPGASKTLYEKIPCSCMFRYESGNYHSAYQPHPLHWATNDQNKIQAAIHKLNQSQDDSNEWEILEELSKQFPELQSNEMLLLDEHYHPLAKKYYFEDEYHPLFNELQKKYKKEMKLPSNITDDIPSAFLYNQIIGLAVECGVYEYISTHCENEDYSVLTNKGI